MFKAFIRAKVRENIKITTDNEDHYNVNNHIQRIYTCHFKSCIMTTKEKRKKEVQKIIRVVRNGFIVYDYPGENAFCE
jgi:hypothetical protein